MRTYLVECLVRRPIGGGLRSKSLAIQAKDQLEASLAAFNTPGVHTVKKVLLISTTKAKR